MRYFHLGLVYVRQIMPICCQFISTHAYQFWSIYLTISQNGINFSRSTSRFYHFKFWVSTSRIALTSSLMMSGPNSPNLNRLDFQIRANAVVLTQAATEAKISSRVVKWTSVNLVCLTGESHQLHCERLLQATADVCQPTVDILNI